MSADRPSRLAKILVVAAWIALAIVANLLFALTPMKAIDNADIGGTGSNAMAYLVLDGHDTLGPADQHYYDAAVSALRADKAHVGSVLDWWSDPLTAPLGTSADGRSAVAMVSLVGQPGTGQAQKSLDAARSVVQKLPTNAGLRARITVPAVSSGASGTPARLTVWQGVAIVAAAALIAALLMLRAPRSTRPLVAAGIALSTAGLSLAVAWPIAMLMPGVFTVFSATLGAVLAIGVVAASTGRHNLPSLALPGLWVAVLTAPLLLARTPALHSVGAAAVGVVVALAASLTLLPALLALAGPGPGPAEPPEPSSDTRSVSRPVTVAALVLAIGALAFVGTQWGLFGAASTPAKPSSAAFVPGRSLPDVVAVKSPHDLRDPAGLIAIDRVSRRLMELPGVRRVESAAWPAGVPWADASLTSAAGRLGDQLDRQAVTFVPQVNAIKSLASAVDQVTGAVNELQRSMTTGLAGLADMQQVVGRVVAGTRDLKDTTVQVSGYLDPVRDWAGGVQNCPGDVLCSAARKVVDPLDRVVANVVVLSDGADRIAAISARTVGAFASTPNAVAQMQSALGQLRSFVPTLERTVEDTIPQVVQLSSFLKNISIDFSDTGDGGFYLSRKALADPTYQNVKKTMFSPDGTTTRLLVFSDGSSDGTRAQQLETAAANQTKYGSLVDSEITVNGEAQLGASARTGPSQDAVLLAVMLLAVVVVVSLWRGVVSGVMVGLGVVASYLVALGSSVVLWQHLLGRELDASAAAVSFAILAACGVPYLVDGIASVRDARNARDARDVPVARVVPVATTPLAALGAVFGGGLMLASGGSLGALSQIGTVLLIGLGALTAMVQLRTHQSVSAAS